MIQFNYMPAKSKWNFKNNYELDNITENAGKDLLIQWNIKFQKFSGSKTKIKFCPKREDKPDLIVTLNKKSALLDLKGIYTKNFLLKEKTVKSYEFWQKENNTPVIICFFNFDSMDFLIDRRFAILNFHKYKPVSRKRSIELKTVKFEKPLPLFCKENLLKYVF